MSFSPVNSILHQFHRASQTAADRFSKELGQGELTIRQVVLLSAVATNAGVSQTALVDATGIDRSTLADMNRRLLKRGLITRRRTKEDARAYAVKLTEEGHRTLASAVQIMARVEDEMMAAISAKNRAELAKLLGAIVQGPS